MPEVCEMDSRVLEQLNELTRLNEQLRAELYERMKLEDELRQSEEYHRRLLDHLQAGFVLVRESDNSILDMNQHAMELSGRAREQIIGRPLSELIGQQKIPETRCQTTLITPGGPLPVLASTAKIHRSGEACLAIIFLPCVPETEAEAGALQHEMEALGRLSGHVAHDFNNLLTAISGYGQMLELSLQEIDPALHKQAQEILHATERAVALTQQLLAFSRRQSVSRRSLDLNKLLNDMQNSLRQILGETISLDYDLQADPSVIQADASQLLHIVTTLAKNARDAMPDGGTFALLTRALDVDEKQGAEIGTPPGAYLQLTVRDTGCGIPAQILPRIFEPFFTTKPKGKGIGMSLAIAYTFVSVNRGHIRVWSEPGTGTRFDIYWPLA